MASAHGPAVLLMDVNPHILNSVILQRVAEPRVSAAQNDLCAQLLTDLPTCSPVSGILELIPIRSYAVELRGYNAGLGTRPPWFES